MSGKQSYARWLIGLMFCGLCGDHVLGWDTIAPPSFTLSSKQKNKKPETQFPPEKKKKDQWKYRSVGRLIQPKNGVYSYGPKWGSEMGIRLMTLVGNTPKGGS